MYASINKEYVHICVCARVLLCVLSIYMYIHIHIYFLYNVYEFRLAILSNATLMTWESQGEPDMRRGIAVLRMSIESPAMEYS